MYKEARKIVRRVLTKQLGPQVGNFYYNDKLKTYRRMKWYGGCTNISKKKIRKIEDKVHKKLRKAGIDFIVFEHITIISSGYCGGEYGAFVLKLPYGF